MTNPIDPLTGLPQLPENQFWRVSRTNVEEFTGPSKPTHVLQLIEREEVPESTKTSYSAHRFGKRKGLPNNKRPFTEIVPAHTKDSVVKSLFIAELEKIEPPYTREETQEQHAARLKKWDAQGRKFLKSHPNATADRSNKMRFDYSYYGSAPSYRHTNDFYYIDPTVTPETILRTANKVIDGIEQARVAALEAEEKKRQDEVNKARREAELNQYVGDYPPRYLLP